MRALVFVYIIEEVAHTHVQNAPGKWLLSTPGQGVVLRLLSEICWLRIRMINICDPIYLQPRYQVVLI